MEYSRPLRRTLLINEVHECLQNMYLLNMPSCEVWKTSNKDFAGSKVLEIHFKSFEADNKKIRCFDQLKYKKKGHGFALKISRAYGGNLQDCTLKILHVTFLDLNARTSIGVGGKQHEDVNHCSVTAVNKVRSLC